MTNLREDGFTGVRHHRQSRDGLLLNISFVSRTKESQEPRYKELEVRLKRLGFDAFAEVDEGGSRVRVNAGADECEETDIAEGWISRDLSTNRGSGASSAGINAASTGA